MDSIRTNSHKQDNYILKSNLWKFFKALRAQANPIYCLLVASPISYAWITILDKADSSIQKRISIAQFVNSLKKMPSTGKYYRLSIYTYHVDSGRKQLVEVSFRPELSLEIATQLLPGIVAYLCITTHERGERLDLSAQQNNPYRIKARYIDELQTLVEQCNNTIFAKSGETHL